MQPMIRKAALPFLVIAVLLAVAGSALVHKGRAAAYDYLALAVSWSPSYCDTEDGRDNKSQCAAGRRYAFLVHGLWPEDTHGWPEYCASDESFVPQSVIDGMRDLMPSKSLMIHEWKRHGTCSGLTPRGYFATIRRLFSKLRIPDRYLAPDGTIVISPAELAADFLAANPWLSRDMVSVRCGNRRDTERLGDVIFCFTGDLEPQPCGANERRQCAAPELTLPPVR